MSAVGSTSARAAYPTRIRFSGFEWQVKSSNGKVGPGPNYFSDSSSSVWVDPVTGQLHMKIRKVGGRWYCSEVILNQSLGYGEYRFYLASPVDALDPSVVLGLFTWSDFAVNNNTEMDIEFARWGAANNLNAQYVVQPYTDPAKIHRWSMPAGKVLTLHSLTWDPGSAAFQSFEIGNSTPLQSRTFNSGVPPEGNSENARINLWLFRGRAPLDKQEVHIVIERFEFTPH